MEYFINVYNVVRKGYPHSSVEHYDNRVDAIQDIGLMLNIKSSSIYTYIHTIHVTDDKATIIDLRGA